MSGKTIKSGIEAQEALIRGVKFIADVVALTEGPRGRNVLLGQRAIGQSPKCSRDGVTVCNYINPSDPTEQMGSDLIREACQKTDSAVGDGTTATAVLARGMIVEGFRLISNGENPMAMERGIHKAIDVVRSQLINMSQQIEGRKLFQVATVSAHGDAAIGELVASAIEKAGRDGVVTAEPSSTADTYVECVAGLELPKSNLLHSAFITHPEEMKAELHDCRILLWEGVIATAKSIVPILKQVKESKVPLLIIAGGYETEALAIIIKNKFILGLELPINAVRMEAYGERRKEVMRDIAALTGGKAYTEDMGTKIENVLLSELGSARKVITNMSKTQIIDGKGNQAELAGRVADIKSALMSASGAESAALRTRLASLLGGITIIKVGGVTVTEMEEKKDRVVDAMSASKAALESGIVAGGGMALLRASVAILGMRMTAEERVGAMVVYAACREILKQIAINTGVPGDSILSQAMATPDLGFNAVSGEFENLIETGIIDPVSVVCESLNNAAAVACSILTMGATVVEESDAVQK